MENMCDWLFFSPFIGSATTQKCIHAKRKAMATRIFWSFANNYFWWTRIGEFCLVLRSGRNADSRQFSHPIVCDMSIVFLCVALSAFSDDSQSSTYSPAWSSSQRQSQKLTEFSFNAISIYLFEKTFYSVSLLHVKRRQKNLLIT